MTIQSQTWRHDYTSTGGTEYPYTFRILDEAHLTVMVEDVTQVLNSDYTVDNVGDPSGGTVTFATAPTVGAAVAIVRNVPLTQLTDFTENDHGLAETREDAHDKSCMIDQQLQEQVDRALLFPAYSSSTGGLLPEPEVGKTLEWLAVSPPTLRNVTPAVTGISVPISASNGGTGQDTSSNDGLAILNGGTWRFLRAYADIREYGATCNGTANDNSAILEAMADGHTRIFLPANTRWIPSTNTIPAGHYIGEDWNTVTIESADPVNDYLYAEDDTIIENARYRHKFGYDEPFPQAVDKYVKCRYMQNKSGADAIVAAWPDQFLFMKCGGASGGDNDRPGITVVNHGSGGGLFVHAEVESDGPAVHVWNTSTAGAWGILVERLSTGIGLEIRNNGANGATGDDLYLNSYTRTSGQMFHIFHSTSVMTGDAILVQCGYDGTFSGRFLHCINDETTKFEITHAGDVQTAGNIRLLNNQYLYGVTTGLGTRVLIQLDTSDHLALQFDTQLTVGAAGGASALPGNPAGYIGLNIIGVGYRVIPYWAAA